MDNHERMTEFCQQLPLLRDREGFGLGWDTSLVWPDPVDDAVVPNWATSSSAALQAVVFARHVWNANNPAPSMAFWDRTHQEVFARWAARPWWC